MKLRDCHILRHLCACHRDPASPSPWAERVFWPDRRQFTESPPQGRGWRRVGCRSRQITDFSVCQQPERTAKMSGALCRSCQAAGRQAPPRSASLLNSMAFPPTVGDIQRGCHMSARWNRTVLSKLSSPRIPAV